MKKVVAFVLPIVMLLVFLALFRMGITNKPFAYPWSLIPYFLSMVILGAYWKYPHFTHQDVYIVSFEAMAKEGGQKLKGTQTVYAMPWDSKVEIMEEINRLLGKTQIQHPNFQSIIIKSIIKL